MALYGNDDTDYGLSNLFSMDYSSPILTSDLYDQMNASTTPPYASNPGGSVNTVNWGMPTGQTYDYLPSSSPDPTYTTNSGTSLGSGTAFLGNSLGQVFQPSTQPVDSSRSIMFDSQPAPSTGFFGDTPEMSTNTMSGAPVSINQTLPQSQQPARGSNSSQYLEIAKLLAGLYSAGQGRSVARAQRQAASAADPFASQRPQYQQRLAQTYTNPSTYFNSPEAQLMRERIARETAARDAKAGRRSQYGERANELNIKLADALAAYRRDLQAPAGVSTGNPAAAATMMSDAAKTQQVANAAPLQAISDILQGNVNSSNYAAALASLKGGAIPPDQRTVVDDFMSWFKTLGNG